MRCRPLAVLQAMEPIAGLRRHTWVFGIVRAEGAAPVMRYTSCARKPFNAWATAWWPRSDSGRATALKVCSTPQPSAVRANSMGAAGWSRALDLPGPPWCVRIPRSARAYDLERIRLIEELIGAER